MRILTALRKNIDELSAKAEIVINLILGELMVDALKKYRCPRCNYPVNKSNICCPNCGQPIDWRNE